MSVEQSSPDGVPAPGDAAGASARPAPGVVAQGALAQHTPAVSQEEVREAATGTRRRRRRRKDNPTGEMPLKEHLLELRNRLVKAGIGLALGTVAGFFLYRPTMGALAQPLQDAHERGILASLNFDSVGASFDILLQVSVFIGVILSSPVWLYQVWAFVVPGLKAQEKRYAIGFLSFAIPLFVGGVAIGYLVLPQAVQFFTALIPDGGTNFISANVYIPFLLRLFLAFGFALVLPVIMVGMNMLGVLPGRQIVRHWRITVFIIALIAAIAAPGTDAITMFYLAAPLFLLFAIAIALCLVNDRRRGRRRERQAADLEAEIARGPKPLSEL
jgi:sec-independent protein translocase protein TatC